MLGSGSATIEHVGQHVCVVEFAVNMLYIMPSNGNSDDCPVTIIVVQYIANNVGACGVDSYELVV